MTARMRHGVVISVDTATRRCVVSLDGMNVTTWLLDGGAPVVGDVATVIQDGRRLVTLGTIPWVGTPGPQSPICWDLAVAVNVTGDVASEFDVSNFSDLVFIILSSNGSLDQFGGPAQWYEGPNISNDQSGFLFWSWGFPEVGARTTVTNATFVAMTIWQYLGWHHPDGSVNAVPSPDATLLMDAIGFGDNNSYAVDEYTRGLAWLGQPGGQPVPPASESVSIVRAGVYYENGIYHPPTLQGTEPSGYQVLPADLPSPPPWRLVRHSADPNDVIPESQFTSYWVYDVPPAGAIGGWNYFLSGNGYVITAGA